MKLWTELHVADVSSDTLTHPVKKKQHADLTCPFGNWEVKA